MMFFYDHQYGFEKCHSTNHAIITLVEKVARALDSGEIVVGVYLDIRMAFDAISYPIDTRTTFSKFMLSTIHEIIYIQVRNYCFMYNFLKYLHYYCS